VINKNTPPGTRVSLAGCLAKRPLWASARAACACSALYCFRAAMIAFATSAAAAIIAAITTPSALSAVLNMKAPAVRHRGAGCRYCLFGGSANVPPSAPDQLRLVLAAAISAATTTAIALIVAARIDAMTSVMLATLLVGCARAHNEATRKCNTAGRAA